MELNLSSHICRFIADSAQTNYGTVAFPNRKSYFLDNKLEFLGIKLAESYGFGIPTSKFLRSENSQVILSCLGCFKFKPFVISDFNGIG